jgi:hypothetical protein
MPPTSKRTVRVVFGVTLLWIALLQYVFLGLARAEPYPALILPGFPAGCPGCLLETGVPATKYPELRVRFADGRTQQVPIASVLPPGPSVRLMAFSAAFKDASLKSDPDVVAWLQSRIAGQFPNENVAGLEIIWQSATYKAANRASIEYVPLYTIDFDFGAFE